MAWFYLTVTKDRATDTYTSATVRNESGQVVASWARASDYDRLVRQGDIRRLEWGLLGSLHRYLEKLGVMKPGDRLRTGVP